MARITPQRDIIDRLYLPRLSWETSAAKKKLKLCWIRACRSTISRHPRNGKGGRNQVCFGDERKKSNWLAVKGNRVHDLIYSPSPLDVFVLAMKDPENTQITTARSVSMSRSFHLWSLKTLIRPHPFLVKYFISLPLFTFYKTKTPQKKTLTSQEFHGGPFSLSPFLFLFSFCFFGNEKQMPGYRFFFFLLFPSPAFTG